MDRREFLIRTAAGAATMAGSARIAIAQEAPPATSSLDKGTPAPMVVSAAAKGRAVAVKMLTPPMAPVAPVVEQLHKTGITAVFARIDDFFADTTVERNVREFRKLLRDAGIQFYNTVPVSWIQTRWRKIPALSVMEVWANRASQPRPLGCSLSVPRVLITASSA